MAKRRIFKRRNIEVSELWAVGIPDPDPRVPFQEPVLKHWYTSTRKKKKNVAS